MRTTTRHWSFLAPLAVAAVLAAGFVAPASAAKVPRVVALDRVSGASPHPDACGNPDWAEVAQFGAEVEPHLAIDPADPQRLIASWQQDRYTTGGGALSQGMVLSEDGGRTWKKLDVPGMTGCPEAGSRGITDPWSSFSGDGDVYANGGLIASGGGPLDVVAAHSGDGSTWSPASRLLNRSDYGGYFPDKPVVAADPTRPGNAYVVWAKNSAVPGPFGTLRGINAPLRFTRTTDGGLTWSPESTVYTQQPRALAPFASGMVVLPDGTIAVLVVEVSDSDSSADDGGGTGPGDSLVRVLRSTDGGNTWLPPVTVARHVNAEGLDPEGNFVRNGALPSIAAGAGGAIHVVWSDMRTPTEGVIRLSTSRNGGANWNPPRTVSDLGNHPMMHTVATTPSGRIGVLFNDFRHDTPGDGKAEETVWLTTSRDFGDTWQETKVAGPFDVALGPQSGFLGDYQGLVGRPAGFRALFAAAPPLAKHGPSDVFFARIKMRRPHPQ